MTFSRHAHSYFAITVSALVAMSLSVVVITTPSRPGTTPYGSRADSVSISISMFDFSPARLIVVPGELIHVTNRDYVDHTVTASDGKFNTGDIGHGQTVSFTAPMTPGTYDYDCSIHPFMRGVLVVR
jgi:plastocyanin